MPSGWAHSHYWAGSATPEVPPGPLGSGRGIYPAWQAVIICGSLFGALQGLYERVRARWPR